MNILICIFVSLVPLLNLGVSSAQKEVYVVYLGEHTGAKTARGVEEHHRSFLYSAKATNDSMIYSYKHVINGFSAMLTSEEAHTISEMEGVMSVFLSRPSELQTTRSWDFISLLEANWDASKANGEDLLKRAGYGKDVIVGVLDSGVWPESESFNDKEMEPIPTSWNGTCQSGDQFNSSHCNKKLVGARFYLKGYEAFYGPLDSSRDLRSPRDVDGHGSHTASTVGGRRVPNAAAYGGIGNGTASGGAPLVRLAVYKVCWPVPRQSLGRGNRCLDDDILAAFDDAIADGVGVISVSIGGATSRLFTEDGIAIGALHAVKKNIVVACSAGNSGPDPFTVSNVAPWMITVGASSIDRVFSSPLQLGNGVELQGESVAPNQRVTYPLVYAADAQVPGTTTNLTTGKCLPGSLSPTEVKEKVVFCSAVRGGDVDQVLEVQEAGGAAVVLENAFDGLMVVERTYSIPATVVRPDDTDEILNYVASERAHTATLTPPVTILSTRPAPFMATFTSRGPSAVQPNILKPDVTAPGLNIMAAWSEASSPLNEPADNRVVKYNFDSGTSMSCPHVAAVAALLKAIHSDWSSAAIRSAIMTTAKETNNIGSPITDALGNNASPFDYGSGHIQPSMAADPGLIYDASYDDYLLFLCGSGGNRLNASFKCPINVPPPSSFNYPSLAIANMQDSFTVERTVTNVGAANSSYTVTIDPPTGYLVQISPTTLSFGAIGEKLNFNITVEDVSRVKNVYAFGWYAWSDGIHRVRSPISVWTV